jgi:uncharacterized membrane protein YgaE (UPF0421/DUF939 family)
MAEIGGMAPGPRAFKTAFAVGMAWWLTTLLGEERPVFAAIAALVGMEATIVASMRRTGLQMVGVLGGIVLAVALSLVGSVNPLIIGLAVLFGLWLGRWLGSPDRIGVELSVTALLVVTFGHGDPGFGASRLWETALGGLVAMTTNALIMPPNYLPEVWRDLDRLVARVSRGLIEAVRIFVELPRHEKAAETLQDLRIARATVPRIEERVKLAGKALRFSPLLRHSTPELRRSEEAIRFYRRSAAHAARIARVVQQHAERDHSWSHEMKSPKELLKTAHELVGALAECQLYAQTGDRAAIARMKERLETAQERLAAFFIEVEVERAGTEVERFMDVAAIASELEHMIVDAAELLYSPTA